MDKPNLVYILADDMGWGDVSCLNPQAAFETPCLDRLAREGPFSPMPTPPLLCVLLPDTASLPAGTTGAAA